MNVLGTFTEDINFSQLGGLVIYTGGGFRSGWSRCCLRSQNGVTGNARSQVLNGGAITSGWFHTYTVLDTAGVAATEGLMMVALQLSTSGSWLGLITGASNAEQMSLGYFNGTSQVVLATEVGTSGLTLAAGGTIDIQFLIGGSPTLQVNVYVNNSLIIAYSGNTSITGLGSVDSLVYGVYSGGSANNWYWSEQCIADSDTRALLGLQSQALTGAGTTTQWTNNTYTNINGISYSDANPTYVNTTAKDQEYTVTAPTPAVFSVIGVVQSARACIPSGSTPTALKLGYGSGGVGHFGTGASKSPTVGFADYQQIDQINPITGVAWTAADLTGLQLDMQSD